MTEVANKASTGVTLCTLTFATRTQTKQEPRPGVGLIKPDTVQSHQCAHRIYHAVSNTDRELQGTLYIQCTVATSPTKDTNKQNETSDIFFKRQACMLDDSTLNYKTQFKTLHSVIKHPSRDR